MDGDLHILMPLLRQNLVLNSWQIFESEYQLRRELARNYLWRISIWQLAVTRALRASGSRCEFEELRSWKSNQRNPPAIFNIPPECKNWIFPHCKSFKVDTSNFLDEIDLKMFHYGLFCIRILFKKCWLFEFPLSFDALYLKMTLFYRSILVTKNFYFLFYFRSCSKIFEDNSKYNWPIWLNKH